MQHAVILAHPSPASFNASAAQAWCAAARGLGHRVELRDLYALGFDPRLKASEFPWAPDFAPSEDVLAERAVLEEAGVVVFVYPLWFNAPPAVLKGYVDRVFGAGFGYGSDARPLLTSKALVSITSSGAPDAWAHQTGAVELLRAGFDDHLAAVCGLTVLEHLHFGGVTPGIRSDAVQDMLAEVGRQTVRLLGPAPADATKLPGA